MVTGSTKAWIGGFGEVCPFGLVSDGKALIASAITDMNQTTSSDATFQQMADNIRNISDDANAATSQVLSGYTFYQGGSKKTGTMTNRGAISTTISPGGSYTIPRGYHNGSGRVRASGSATDQLWANETDDFYFFFSIGTSVDVGASKSNVTLVSGGTVETSRRTYTLDMRVRSAPFNPNTSFSIGPYDSSISGGVNSFIECAVDNPTTRGMSWLSSTINVKVGDVAWGGQGYEIDISYYQWTKSTLTLRVAFYITKYERLTVTNSSLLHIVDVKLNNSIAIQYSNINNPTSSGNNPDFIGTMGEAQLKNYNLAFIDE